MPATSVLGLSLALTAAISSLSWIALARAEIREAMVRSDAPSIIAFDEFCFTRWGGLELNVSSISLSGADSSDLSKLGFFLLTRDAWSRVLRQLQNFDITCALQSNHSHLVYTFDGLVQPPNHHGVAVQIRVSMVVRSAMFKIPDPANPSRRAYLSDGVAALPLIYSLLFFAYAALAAACAAVLFRRRRTAYRIHYFMLAVVVLTALNVLCVAEDKSRIGLTGSAHGWDVLFYISRFLTGVSLFALLVLIGSGWSFLKPYLQHREKKALLAVIPLQAIANTAQVAIDESGPFARDSVTWKQVFLIVDIVCCCAVLFPIFWSIKKLREEARSDGKAAVNLRNLTLFRRYYICYIYFTRAAVYALNGGSTAGGGCRCRDQVREFPSGVVPRLARRQREAVGRIHYFMLAVVVLTALNVLCVAEDKSRIGLTGSAHGWDVLFYISRFLTGVSLFALLVLIGSGWSFLKPYLQHREKKALLAVLVDIVCCCAVLFPIFWSIEKLREEARSDGKAAVNGCEKALLPDAKLLTGVEAKENGERRIAPCRRSPDIGSRLMGRLGRK